MYLISAVFSVVVGSWSAVNSAPYAAVVMDARTGKIYHSRNADTRLHPASLTKMMTLYIAFQAIEQNEISLDSYVTVSR
ncbi:MAG: serine hydrolase, partial [Planktomarina sp.]|nr:serine hydrolase [Planktomarina sp.]